MDLQVLLPFASLKNVFPEKREFTGYSTERVESVYEFGASVCPYTTLERSADSHYIRLSIYSLLYWLHMPSTERDRRYAIDTLVQLLDYCRFPYASTARAASSKPPFMVLVNRSDRLNYPFNYVPWRRVMRAECSLPSEI
jgi:hypothetical protein